LKTSKTHLVFKELLPFELLLIQTLIKIKYIASIFV